MLDLARMYLLSDLLGTINPEEACDVLYIPLRIGIRRKQLTQSVSHCLDGSMQRTLNLQY